MSEKPGFESFRADRGMSGHLPGPIVLTLLFSTTTKPDSMKSSPVKMQTSSKTSDSVGMVVAQMAVMLDRLHFVLRQRS